MTKHYGTILRYFDDRGFGFIGADSGEELYFHITSHIPQEISPTRGERVSYNVRMSTRTGKPEAVDVEATGEKSDAKPQKTLRGNDPVWR
jgi:CspA family cold shock protein